MPEIIPEPLEIEKAKALLAWLKKPEVATLRTVIGAKSMLHAQEASESCFKATAGNSYDLKSVEAMKQAQRYRTFLEILDEIIKGDKPEWPLQTVKLKF